MSDPFFFGYGSLVNRSTHNFPSASPARVTGWRRQWRHTSPRKVAFLTAVPAAGQVLDGVIAAVPKGDWAALDVREANYTRRQLDKAQIFHRNPADIAVQIYLASETKDIRPAPLHPILLSYLDCVIKGYLDEFGTSGALDFFTTTDGWDAPILNDRAAPIYPRHVSLTAGERAFVDDNLASLPSGAK